MEGGDPRRCGAGLLLDRDDRGDGIDLDGDVGVLAGVVRRAEKTRHCKFSEIARAKPLWKWYNFNHENRRDNPSPHGRNTLWSGCVWRAFERV